MISGASRLLTWRETQRQLIDSALEQANGNRSEAARLLGISRPTVITKIKEFNLTRWIQNTSQDATHTAHGGATHARPKPRAG